MFFSPGPVKFLSLPLRPGVTTLEVPAGARLLTVQTRRKPINMDQVTEIPHAFFACPSLDKSGPGKLVKFILVNENHEIEITGSGAEYVGTFQLGAGLFVVHVFEDLDEEATVLSDYEEPVRGHA